MDECAAIHLVIFIYIIYQILQVALKMIFNVHFIILMQCID